MFLNVIGYKCGMTRFFNSNGLSLPVTVVKVYINHVIELKKNNDGLIVKIAAYEYKNEKNLNKSIIGFYKKLGVKNFKYIHEFRINSKISEDFFLGKILNANMFNIADKIDISGISKGKGFSGVVKKYNFKTQNASHGNSLSHRAPGSIGQCQTPGKVFKGKKMPGQLGNFKTTIKNIEIMHIYKDLDVILLKGSIPGSAGSKVFLKKRLGH
jgi:large subunit ribosomal protein L3